MWKAAIHPGEQGILERKGRSGPVCDLDCSSHFRLLVKGGPFVLMQLLKHRKFIVHFMTVRNRSPKIKPVQRNAKG